MVSVRRSKVRPFSRQEWEEKRRRWIIEQEETKRRRIRFLAALATLLVAVCLAWVYVVNPGDWKKQAGSYARKLVKFGER